MKDLFEIAGGTVIGSEHVKAGKNNQDAFYWTASDLALVAVVTDGCSDAPHSEVGAKIGARIISESLVKEYVRKNLRNSFAEGEPRPSDIFWENVYAEILSKLNEVLSVFGSGKNVILDYLLFTIFGAIITPNETSIFSVGDGVYFLNGEFNKVGPFPDNAPPYMGYALIGENVYRGLASSGFTVRSVIKTEKLNSLLIGTDGMEYLAEAANKKMPGKDELIDSPKQFWENDCYFKNPDMIRRKLTLANRMVTKIDWENRIVTKEHGLLPDDTTLVVIRRKR